MLKLILLILVALIVGILIYASTKPDTFSIVRKLKINAAPEKIFVEINDFNRWRLWSPWENKDPAMKRTFSGAVLGVGAIYEWYGDKNVGQGRMEITDSIEFQKVLIKLDFFKPFEAHNTAEFSLIAEGDGTLVVWEMRGPQLFISKLMSVFVNMDKMIGTDFEIGLINLKRLSELQSETTK